MARRRASLPPWPLAGAAALLLFLAFPPAGQPWCAWIALIPWLRLVRALPPRAAFAWSYLIGILFFLGSTWWLTAVTAAGWVILGAYLALYFGAFGACAARAAALGAAGWLVLPAAWVALEWARSHLLGGFGWNALAFSQAPWPAMLQPAAVTGAWGVSFLLVLANVAGERLLRTRGRLPRETLAAVGVLALAAGYGGWRLTVPATGLRARVALVQGSIPQEQKWDEAFTTLILDRYAALTEDAARTAPDLIVWPETSVPGSFGVDETLTQRVLAAARRAQRPLLVGAPVPALRGTPERFYNRAVLVGADGLPGPYYDKLHLVPYGEFIPGEAWLPWLRGVLPPIGDFAPGEAHTVFRAGAPLPPFSVLICFEDVFPDIARRMVREGARMLAVITNDAWFGPTAAAYQHAQASTLRAVELGVPVVRAANTGWSGCIDAAGRWTGSVRDGAGRELFVAGTHTCEVRTGAADTLYLAWGDWFAALCACWAVGWYFLRTQSPVY
jgi:apolipoprotein N-acyltransferase